ncbi:GNAT family N-acetyltransferase [Cryptosporangium minutisporangium]|uniref:GNAT family N-acetyltransferase n=1 Tax=Cryptosporangium minutisporangium TaxID=113569 RepID=UPI0035E8D597
MTEEAAGRSLSLANREPCQRARRPGQPEPIIRGALQSASIGYWVGAAHTGRGFATAAVAQAVGLAFDQLQLHRMQAEILVHNAASEAVCARTAYSSTEPHPPT